MDLTRRSFIKTLLVTGAALGLPKAVAATHAELDKLPLPRPPKANVAFVTTVVNQRSTVIRHGLKTHITTHWAYNIHGKPVTLTIQELDLDTVRVTVNQSHFMRLWPMAYRVVLTGPWDRRFHLGDLHA